MVILGVLFCSSLIKSSTSKLVKRYVLMYFTTLMVYTLVWITMSTVMAINKTGTLPDILAEIIGSFSGIIINSLRISDPALWNYIKSKIFRPKRKDSVARNNSVYESTYIQMFTHVFSMAVLKSIISLNLVMASVQEYEETEAEWSREHYEERQSMKFDQEDIGDLLIPEKIRYAVDKYKCLAVVCAPRVFRHLRQLEGVTDEMISESFDVSTNLNSLKSNSGNDGGRSASFFYFSYDRKFLIKTISRSEKRFFMKEILSDYHMHRSNHDDSILSKIIGIFTFKFQDNTKSRVMVQANIFPKVQLIGVFDLKGSKLDRSNSKSSKGVTMIKRNTIYKDLDFLNTKKKVHVEEIDLQRFKISIFKDTSFLNKHNIIDYSLLLGISEEYNSEIKPLIGVGHDKGYYFYTGIIDYLQSYNKFKRLEAFSKNLILLNVPEEDISVTSSDKYCERFTSFVCSIITT